MRAVVYCRVSTEEQARDGYSLAAQEERARGYCIAKGWDVTAVYSDAGRSGKSIAGREAVAQLLQDADAHAFDQVIFWRLDRLGRNLKDLLEISERLEKAGVGIVSIQEGFDTATTAGRLMRNILGSLAVFERETTIDRIQSGLQEKARQGHVLGQLSLGYKRDEMKRIQVDDTISPLILSLFERYSTGSYSLADIASWANNQGLRSTRGNQLDKLSMHKLLTNVHYVGDVAYHRRQGGGVVAPDAIPAIVSRELFDAVQAQLTNRRRLGTTRPWGRVPYPLTGIAVCAYCGAGLIGSSSARGSYLRCSTAARLGRLSCRQPMVQAALIESQVGAYIEGFTLPDNAAEQVMDELRALYEVSEKPDREIAETERLLAAHKRLFLMADEDEVTYRRNTGPLKRRLAELQGSGQILDVEAAMYHMRNIGPLWWQSGRQEQREFVMERFDRILVEGAQIKELTPKPAYAPFFMLDRVARFGGVCSWLPGLDSNQRNYNPVINPRTKSPFLVPALAVA